MDETQKQTVIDYQTAFDTEYGRRVLADLKKTCRNWDSVVIRKDEYGRVDPYELIFAEGQRSMLIHILAYINKNPDDEQQEDYESEAGNAAN